MQYTAAYTLMQDGSSPGPGSVNYPGTRKGCQVRLRTLRKLTPLWRLLLVCCWGLIGLIGWRQRGCAIGAASSHQWDAAQAVWAVASSGRFLRFLRFVAGHQCVHRAHDEKVDDECYYQESDNRINECACLECAVGKFNSPVCKAATRNWDKRCDDIVDKSIDHSGESSAYHDADC